MMIKNKWRRRKSNEQDDETTKDKDEIPVNPTEPNVEKLDVEALKQLGNTKYSWWIKLNSEHETPEIPPDIKNLIDKHDGIYVGDTSKKVIYLTFDEGYENGYTPQILDVLKENDVKPYSLLRVHILTEILNWCKGCWMRGIRWEIILLTIQAYRILILKNLKMNCLVSIKIS